MKSPDAAAAAASAAASTPDLSAADTDMNICGGRVRGAGAGCAVVCICISFGAGMAGGRRMPSCIPQERIKPPKAHPTHLPTSTARPPV
jgi:hypothetical protein